MRGAAPAVGAMTTQDLITRAEFIYKKARGLRGRCRCGVHGARVSSAGGRCARHAPADAPPCPRRPQYQKYSEEKNKDRLLNPGDAFSELCMDFEFQIAALLEVRPARAAAPPLRHPAARHPLRSSGPTGCRGRLGPSLEASAYRPT